MGDGQRIHELHEDRFWFGFDWCVRVFRAMSHRASHQEIMAFFKQVAAGDVSLQPTPEEWLQGLNLSEAQKNDPLYEGIEETAAR